MLHHVSEHNVMVVKTMGHKFVTRPRHKRLSFELFKYPPFTQSICISVSG